MAIGVSDLLIRVKAETGEAVAGMSDLSLGMVGLGLGAAAAAAGFVKMGMDAQNQLAIVQGLTGSSASQMQGYTRGLETMALSLGLTMDEAAKGLYYVVSAGFKGADALNVLDYAAMAAKASGADLADVTHGLSGVLNAYGAGANQAGKYTDIMTAAVTYGMQSYSDFSTSIGRAAVTASTAHIPFSQLAAAESALTEKGIPAHTAMMSLTFMIQKVMLDSDATGAAVKKLGGHFNETAYNSLDLMGKLNYLRDSTGLTTAEFLKLIGGSRSSVAALALLGDHGKAYTEILKHMTTQGSQTAAAFAVHDATMKGGFEDIAAALSVAALRFTTFITPFVGPMLKNAAVGIVNVMGAIQGIVKFAQDGSFPMRALHGAIIAVAVAFGVLGGAWATINAMIAVDNFITAARELIAVNIGAIQTAIAIWADVAAWVADTAASTAAAIAEAAALWPVYLFIAAIALLAIGVVLLITHWKQVTDFLGNVWNTVWSHASAFFIQQWNTIHNMAVIIWTAISTFFSNLWHGVTTTFTNVWTGITNFFSQVWSGIATTLRNDWMFISLVFQIALGDLAKMIVPKVLAIIGFISGPFQVLVAILGGIWNLISAVVRLAIEIIVKLVQTFGNNLLAMWHRVWDPLSVLVGNVWSAMTSLITNFMNQQLNNIRSVWNTISGFLGNVWNGIRNVATSQWDRITSVISNFLNTEKLGIEIMWNAATNFLGGVWNRISSTASSIWNNITGQIRKALNDTWVGLQIMWNGAVGFLQNTWHTIENNVITMWNNITNRIQSTAGQLKTALMAPFISMRDSMSSVLGGMERFASTALNNSIKGFFQFLNGVGDALDWIAKAVGVSPPYHDQNPPQISFPGLAKGTSNWAGGMAWVGEQGPELAYLPPGSEVIPHGKSMSLVGSGAVGAVPGFSGGLPVIGGIGDLLGKAGDFAKWLTGGAGNLLDKAMAAFHATRSPLVGMFGDLNQGIGSLVHKAAQQLVQGWINFFNSSTANDNAPTGVPSAPGSLAGSENFSEFHGFNGDCGETAELLALHVLKGTPLAGNILNSMVRRDQARGWAGGNGVMSLGGIRNDLSTFEHIQSASYGGGAWQQVLEQYAGRKPVIFLYSNAGALPGDERGVHWHFNTALGKIDSSHFLFGDGDNSMAPTGRLNIYSLANLANASPQGEVVPFADGGWINEPIRGIGASGRRYTFGENGSEYISPHGAVTGGGDTYQITVTTNSEEKVAKAIIKEQKWHRLLHP